MSRAVPSRSVRQGAGAPAKRAGGAARPTPHGPLRGLAAAAADAPGQAGVRQLSRAAASCGHAAPLRALASGQAPAARPVVQRRLPVMTSRQIRAAPKAAAELVIHRIREFPDDVFLGFFVNGHEVTAKAAKTAVIDKLATNNTDTGLIERWYDRIARNLPTREVFTFEDNKAKTPEPAMLKGVLAALPAVLKDLETVMGNPEAIMKVFGIADPSGPMGVYKTCHGVIDAHLQAGTSPIVISGDKEHREWIGEGAIATKGQATTVQLGEAFARKLAANDAEARSSLIHEFTHATSGTEDLAYDIDTCRKLKPAQRVKNATTHEHCLAVALGNTDERYFYDESFAADKSVAKGATVGSARRDKARRAAKIATELWNMTANLYNVAVDAREQIHTKEVRPFVDAATHPHTPFAVRGGGSGPGYELGLALIEDRTRALIKFKKAKGLKSTVMRIPQSEIDGTSPETLLAQAIAVEFAISEPAAQMFIKRVMVLVK